MTDRNVPPPAPSAAVARAWAPDRRRLGAGDLLALATWTAAVAWAFLDAVTLRGALFYFDITEINYPYRDFLAGELRSGRLARWFPGLFNGLPLFSESQAGYLHPLKLLYLALPTWQALNLDTVLSVWLTGLAAFGWLRRHVGPAGALAGAGIFGVGGYTWAHLVHTSMINALTSVPLCLWALEAAWDAGRLRPLAFGAVALACQVFAGHLQDTILTVGLLALLAIVRAATGGPGRERLRAVGMAAGMVLLGIALAAVQWVPSLELLARSPRADGLSYEDVTYGSWSPELLPTLLVREGYGTRARDTDWMDGFYPYHEMNTYLGLVGLALAAVGAGAYRDRWVAGWLVVAGVAVVLMLGRFTVVFDFVYRVPVVGSSRIPVRYHLWLTAAVAALAAVGVDRLARPGRVALRGPLLAMAALVALALPILYYAYQPALEHPGRWSSPLDRKRFGWLADELSTAALRNGALALVAGVVATLAARTPHAGPRRRLAALLPVLAIADLLAAHRHDAPTIDPRYWTAPPPTVEALRREPVLGRIHGLADRSAGEPGYASEPFDFFTVRDNLGWSLPPVWGLRSGGGHTPIFPRRTKRFWDALRRQQVRLDIEGVTHLLAKHDPDAHPWGPPLRVGRIDIHRNPYALPRARLVGRPVYADDDLSAARALRDLGPEARDRVVVEDPSHPLPPDAAASGTATLTVDEPERVEVRTESPAAAYLFLADSYDPGWSATLDGEPVPIVPADVAFRAVYLPAGPHHVVFTYRPAGFALGLGISLFGLSLTLPLLIRPWTVAPLRSPHAAPLPRSWPCWEALIIAAVLLASAARLGPDGRPAPDPRWSDAFHRFTWGAGLEAIRPPPPPDL